MLSLQSVAVKFASLYVIFLLNLATFSILYGFHHMTRMCLGVL